MALAVGDLVAVALNPAGDGVQPQPPRFGRIDDDSSGFDVVWEDGAASNVVTATTLDKILAPVSRAWEGRRVLAQLISSGAFQQSSDFQGIVIKAYRRDNGGGGSPTTDRNLVKLFTSGAYLEVPSDNLRDVGGGA